MKHRMKHTTDNLKIADKLDALKEGCTINLNGYTVRRNSEYTYTVDDERLSFVEAYDKITEGEYPQC